MASPLPTGIPRPLGEDLFLDLLTSGYAWVLGPDRTIDWSISSGPLGETWSNGQLIIDRMRQILDFVSSVADVRFNFVGTFSSPIAANLGGSEINVAPDRTLEADTDGVAYLPQTRANLAYVGAPGDIFVNQQNGADLYPYSLSSIGGELLLHEVGHALGLKHPHDDDDNGRPTFEEYDFEDFDSVFDTVMSYVGYSGDPLVSHAATFMTLDVIALQALYGINHTTNLGDTTHRIEADGGLRTLWDAGGLDTLSFATASKGFIIAIPYISFTSAVPTRYGYATPRDNNDLTWVGLTGEYEVVIGSPFDDRIFGNFQGNTLLGGAGNDFIDGEHGANQLRGGEGDDELLGGDNFDDLHGNVGNDTVRGGGFDDWVVGGQGNDMLFGGDGGDLCYGQLGSDTIDGGAGADAVVGGQANDSLNGGSGDDFITGDRGDDTLTGGAGADTFQTSNVTGLDRVTDFSQAEGDKVLVVAGSSYTLRQEGPDTIVDLGLGNQMVLVGVTLTSLTAGWIVGG